MIVVLSLVDFCLVCIVIAIVVIIGIVIALVIVGSRGYICGVMGISEIIGTSVNVTLITSLIDMLSVFHWFLGDFRGFSVFLEIL